MAETQALVAIEQERAVAEIKAQVLLARNFPRDIDKAKEKIISECKRPSFAKLAMYQYPRGKTVVKGSSIRMTEMMARSLTNIKYGIRELNQYEDHSDVQSYAWDMENNVLQTREFTVKHLRKSGQVMAKLDDPRDIYENVANQGARRMRACLLSIIPRDIVDAAEEEVDSTLIAGIKKMTGKERAAKTAESFKEVGIDSKLIEKKYKCKMIDLTVENYAELLRIYNSLKDGIGKAWDYFDVAKPVEANEETEKLSDAINRRGQQNKVESQSEEDEPVSGDENAKPPVGKTAELPLGPKGSKR